MNKTSLALLTLILFITTHCANANKKALTIPLDSTKITPLVIFIKTSPTELQNSSYLKPKNPKQYLSISKKLPSLSKARISSHPG